MSDGYQDQYEFIRADNVNGVCGMCGMKIHPRAGRCPHCTTILYEYKPTLPLPPTKPGSGLFGWLTGPVQYSQEWQQAYQKYHREVITYLRKILSLEEEGFLDFNKTVAQAGLKDYAPEFMAYQNKTDYYAAMVEVGLNPPEPPAPPPVPVAPAAPIAPAKVPLDEWMRQFYIPPGG